jgi:hypothetical protein
MNIETLREAATRLPEYQASWLRSAVRYLRKDFREIGYPLPHGIQIDVSFPTYPRKKVGSNWMGSHWRPFDTHLIHINPTLTGLWALDILVHELVHAVAPEKAHHGGEFMKIAKAIGLDDSGPSAEAKDPLMRRLIAIRNTLGPYPLVTDCLEAA